MVEFSREDEIRKRTALVEELFAKVLYDEEPVFISDEATIFDVSMTPGDELRARLFEHYRARLTYEDLKKPLWQLLDDLNPAATPKKLRRTTSAKIASGYWLIVAFAFFGLWAGGGDMIGTGALPVVWVTVPWSIPVVMGVFASHPPGVFEPLSASDRFWNSTPGTFLILVVFCAGLNAILIFAVGFTLERLRRSPRTG